jgi:hypothetical protein
MVKIVSPMRRFADKHKTGIAYESEERVVVGSGTA